MVISGVMNATSSSSSTLSIHPQHQTPWGHCSTSSASATMEKSPASPLRCHQGNALPLWLGDACGACARPDGADLLRARDVSALLLPETKVPAACAAPLLGASAGCCSSPPSARRRLRRPNPRPVVSLAYPLYASVRAIETKSAVDDQQWLTYWVLYSFITLFELTFAPVLEWLPFWSYAKLFFNCWLVLPQFNGAAHVYEHFVRPMIVNQQVVNIWYIPKKDESSRPDDVISAAQRYIEQNGSKAFENLVNKFKSSNPRRSILEEVEVERRARIQRESEAREVNPFFNPEYQY